VNNLEPCKSVLVIGDTILDISIHLEAVGLSLETPTIKTTKTSESKQLGGASNVVNNILALGSKCTFITTLDTSKRDFLDFWVHSSLDKQLIYEERENTTKSRYWVNRESSKYKYLQVNEGGNSAISKRSQKEILQYLSLNIKKFDRVVLVDYQLGLFSSNSFIREIIDVCSSNNTQCVASSQTSSNDSRHSLFKGCDLVVLNFDEACSNDPQFKNTLSTQSLQDNLDASVCVTLGSSGSKIGIKENQKEFSYPAFNIVVKDTCGAGDSFLSSISLLDWKNNPERSLKISNAWSALSVQNIGTHTPDLCDLKDILGASISEGEKSQD